MYRMLIVDDEPIIVEGLRELFLEMEHLELDVHIGYNGRQAIDLIKSLRVDIVLTDIEMPELSGLELQREALSLGSSAKFIFLTGYDDFNYIQTTNRNGAIDFIIKTEGDEPIIAAVEKAIAELKVAMNTERLLGEAKSHMQRVRPVLRREFLLGLLNGAPMETQLLEERFHTCDVMLDPRRPVFALIGRIDQWRPDMREADRSLFMYAVSNITDEFLSARCRLEHIAGEADRMIWLFQPLQGLADESADGDNFKTFLLSSLEAVQNAARTYLKLVCSFAATSAAYDWKSLPIKFDRLTLLFDKGIGLGSEMLLTDERVFAAVDRELRAQLRGVRLLDGCLARRDEQAFFRQFNELMDVVGESEALQAGLSLEIFYELTSIFIAHLNRLDLLHSFSDHYPIGHLLSIQTHGSWQDVRLFFENIARFIFDSSVKEAESETNELVHKLEKYVLEHMGDDISLNKLAEIVYLTPFYLSRLYKRKTGHSISDFIVASRLDRARLLLGDPSIKIHDIGQRVGCESASYFAQFFKKHIGMTPQEYRDSLKRI